MKKLFLNQGWAMNDTTNRILSELIVPSGTSMHSAVVK